MNQEFHCTCSCRKTYIVKKWEDISPIEHALCSYVCITIIHEQEKSHSN